MTKQEFVGRVAQKAGLSQRDAAKAVDAFIDSISDALRAGDSVTFTGFGKFSTAHRKTREGVNPRLAGAKVHIPAANVPKFTAGSSLKRAASGIRRDADLLDREYRDFETSIQGSRRALRRLAS